jgi:hypothetical protein
MEFIRRGVVRRVGWGVAAALLLALIAWLAVRLAGAHQLAVAQDRFEAAVGPIPRIVEPDARSTTRRPAFIELLGGPARLPNEADLARMRQLFVRAPATWSPEEIAACRRFLAANASLQAAADRAVERRGMAMLAPVPSWNPVDVGPMFIRAGAQTALLKLRIRLALHDRSFTEVRRGMEALAAEADAFEAEPGGMLLLGLSQQKGLLQAMAWVVEERDVDSQDLAALRRLLPHRTLAAAVRKMFAGEAGYLLAYRPPALSDADVAKLLDGYRQFSLTLEQGRSAIGAESQPPGATAHPNTLPAAFLAAARPTFESNVEQIATIGAARQLAELALDLRLAVSHSCAYPATLAALPLARESDPFTAQRPRYLRDAQGGAVLANPSAAAAWDALPHCDKTKRPPYVWQLPRPCAAPQLARGL